MGYFNAGALCRRLGFSQCKLILAIYTWICMYIITKSQLYCATLVSVGVTELEESDTSGATKKAVNGLQILVPASRMQD